MGNNGPLQRFKPFFGRRAIGRALARVRPAAPRDPAPATLIEQILDLARWTTSGDNAQPGKFEIVNDDRVVVHLAHRDTENIYEYRDWEPTILAGGMMLESLRVAASVGGGGSIGIARIPINPAVVIASLSISSQWMGWSPIRCVGICCCARLIVSHTNGGS